MPRNGEIPLTEEVLRELENHKKIDVKREKKGSQKKKRQRDVDDGPVLELAEQAEQKDRAEKFEGINKKKIEVRIKDSVITNTNLPEGEGVETDIEDAVIGKRIKGDEKDYDKEDKLALEAWLEDQKEVVHAEQEDDALEKLKKEETELVEKIQKLPKSHPKEPLSEEKKEIIKHLEANRDRQKEILQAKKETNEKPEILEQFGGDYGEIMKGDEQKSNQEIIKEETGKESPKELKKEPKVFQQQKFTDEYADNLEARQETEELAKQPSPEALQEALEKDREAKRSAEEALLTYGEPLIEAQKRLIENQEKEIAELKEALENAKKVESKLAAMENALEKKIEELTPKEATKLDKFKKFITNPKVKLAIGIGLIGAASVATGGGALVGAWLHLPYGLGISALGGTSNLATALLGSGFMAKAYGDKIKNGFRENMKEVLGIIKGKEKTEKVGREKISVEQKPMGELLRRPKKMKKNPPEIETSEEATRENNKQPEKANEIDVIEGLGSAKELTPEEKSVMRQVAKDNVIDIISPSAEVLETKKAKRVNLIDDFVKDFKAKKLTGQDLFSFSAQIAIWMKEAKDSGEETVGDAIIEKIISSELSDDNSELQGEIINAMVEYAKKDEFYRKSKKEVLSSIGWLTFRNTKEEILKVKGISAETKNWL